MLPYRDSRIIRITLVFFFVFLVVYAIYEAQGILLGPVIYVPSTTVTVTDPYTIIKGRAERITELRLNGKPIPVTEDGDFEEPYILAGGSNHLILDARDAHGRTTRKVLDIIYTPPETVIRHSTSTPPGVQ